jgi:hypothetical protein
MKSKITCLTITALLALTTVAQADFFNGFEGTEYPSEVATYDWQGVVLTGTGAGTLGATSADGAYHVETVDSDYDPDGIASASTYWGFAGYNDEWGGGFTTSIDLYLDASLTPGYFSWTSAIADNFGGDLDGYTFTGSVSGSNYSIDVSSLEGGSPTDTTSWTTDGAGWYTLQHSFTASGDYLQVELSILDSSDTPLTSWTFDTSYAITGVGGSAYGYFYGPETFAIDNTSMTTAVVPVPGALLLAGFGLSCAGLHLRKRRN